MICCAAVMGGVALVVGCFVISCFDLVEASLLWWTLCVSHPCVGDCMCFVCVGWGILWGEVLWASGILFFCCVAKLCVYFCI